jgi:UDP-glucose 4-epimerase
MQTNQNKQKAKQKILVTGGAGYIGSHTIIELLSAGYDVVSVDNFSHSKKETFSRIKKITGVSVKNYAIDLCDQKKIEILFKKQKHFDGVIHFAAFKAVGESVLEPVKYFKNNIDSLLSIIACSEKYAVPAIVFSSSCAVYGSVSKLPVSESTPMGIAESPYAATKQMGERMLADFAAAQKKTKVVALRYFNPVGAHESGLLGEQPLGKSDNLVPVITEAAIGKRKSLTIFGDDYKTRDGTCVRDYVHVSDIARAHVRALQYLAQKSSPSYDVFNLGTGKGVTVLELCKAFEKVSGLKLNYHIGPRRAGDIPAVYSDSRKALKLLGWKPELDLYGMMESAWKWQKSLHS